MNLFDLETKMEEIKIFMIWVFINSHSLISIYTYAYIIKYMFVKNNYIDLYKSKVEKDNLRSFALEMALLHNALG